MKLHKFDELDSLLNGLHYIENNNSHELYYWEKPTDEQLCHKVPFDFSRPYPYLVRAAPWRRLVCGGPRLVA